MEAAESSQSLYRIFGDFNDVLGRGGNALVRMGAIIATGERVAIKRLIGGASTAFRRATDEIAVIKHLHHPNIYRFIDFYTSGPKKMDIDIVFELVEGPALSDEAFERSRQRDDGLSVLSPLELTSLLLTMLDVLVYLDCKSIIHRDIKPGNILMASALALNPAAVETADGDASSAIHGPSSLYGSKKPGFSLPIFKLIDFGSAMDLERNTESYSTDTLSTTGPRHRVEGTEPYLSPEMLRFPADVAELGNDEDHKLLTTKLDVWSLGATLLHLATDVKILDCSHARSFSDTKKKLKDGTWNLKADLLDSTDDTRFSPAQRQLWLDLPSEVQDAISACLTASPEDRPRARDLLESSGIKSLAMKSENVFLKVENNQLKADLGVAKSDVSGLKTEIILLEMAVRDLTPPTRPTEAEINTTTSEALVTALRTHMSDAIICRQACSAIENIVRGNGTNQAKVDAAGGCELLVAVLATHASNAAVCGKVCGALRSVTANNVCNQTKVGLAGGCVALVNALKTHASDATVCQQACGAIANVTINPVNEAIVGLVGGCELLVTATQRHSSNAALCEHACGAIGHLAINAENRAKVGIAGGCEVLLSTLTRHSHNAAVCEQACAAIANVTELNVANQSKIGMAGGCQILLDVLIAHASNANVCGKACGAIAKIAHNHAENKAKLGSTGGCEVLVRALKAHSSNASICANICEAIANVAPNDLNTNKLVSLGVKPVLKALQRTHAANAAALVEINRALDNIRPPSIARMLW